MTVGQYMINFKIACKYSYTIIREMYTINTRNDNCGHLDLGKRRIWKCWHLRARIVASMKFKGLQAKQEYLKSRIFLEWRSCLNDITALSRRPKVHAVPPDHWRYVRQAARQAFSTKESEPQCGTILTALNSLPQAT